MVRLWERKAGVCWVRDRVGCALWWSGETPFSKGVKSVRGKLSLECHVVEWLLDSVEAGARLLSQMVVFF